MLNCVVSSDWLNANLNDLNLVILDASFKTKKSKFEDIQIKNARYFDIKNEFSEQKSNYPNTILSPEKFEIACQKLGINKKSKIVVYDNLGIYTSPRVWWLFKTMGHHNVTILNGGLPNWIEKGFITEQIIKHNYKLGNFKAFFKTENVKYFDFVKSNTITQKFLTIDARSSDRFKGLTPESRVGLRSGNIPNSINIPYQLVLENGKFKSTKELSKLFTNFVKTKRPLIFSCGSGITACIILVASQLVLENKTAVYDGSWTEYAQLEK